MNIREVTAEEYRRLFPQPQIVYNSVEFTELNAHKADRVIRVTAESDDGYPALGLTVGEIAGRFVAPFSAPFACFDFNREHRAQTMLDAAAAISSRFPGLTLTLPPALYGESMIAKTQMAFLTAGARQLYLDWNYHIDLTRDYESLLTSPNRKKLRHAEREGFRLEPSDPMRAYEIIRRNRESKGYPLRMSAELVLATVRPQGPVEADFFVLTDGNRDAAAAMVYHVRPGIGQVIYWGDVPQAPCRNAMNLLAAELSKHYAARGMRILDIGPSGTEGHPSAGLSDFKDTIGSTCTPKPVIRLATNS